MDAHQLERRFQVIAIGRQPNAVPIRLEFWSIREALCAERAYHTLGYYVSISPVIPYHFLDAS